jgi:hypothetical protein
MCFDKRKPKIRPDFHDFSPATHDDPKEGESLQTSLALAPRCCILTGL